MNKNRHDTPRSSPSTYERTAGEILLDRIQLDEKQEMEYKEKGQGYTPFTSFEESRIDDAVTLDEVAQDIFTRNLGSMEVEVDVHDGATETEIESKRVEVYSKMCLDAAAIYVNTRRRAIDEARSEDDRRAWEARKIARLSDATENEGGL